MVIRRLTDAEAPLPGVNWEPLSLSNGKRELVLKLPWTNASGTLGFSTEASSWIDLSHLGAFVTNPISFARREPAGGPRYVPTPGGFVLHTGLPNPGLRACIRRYRRRWGSLACPVIVHLIAESPDELARMAEMLESVEEIAGLEIGVVDDDPRIVADLMRGAASRELPVLARLPMNAGSECMWAASDAGAVGLSLAPPRAIFPAPGGKLVRGRLYGPAVFPIALEAVSRLRAAGVRAPILAAGGIGRRHHVLAMMDAGASAVQLDSVLWTQPEAVLVAERPD